MAKRKAEHYEPKPGDRVRVLEVWKGDPNPNREIGEEFIAREIYRCSSAAEGFFHVTSDGKRHADGNDGVIARFERVEPVEQEPLARLMVAYSQIGPNARAALVEIAERMARGRQIYNEDFDNARNWRAEAKEELLDGCVYLAVEIVKGREK